MTTVLTPVEKLGQAPQFMIGVTHCYLDGDLVRRADDHECIFYRKDLYIIFPDGVPVIVPDKPKEVRCVLERSGPLYFLTDGQETAVLTWVERNTAPGKTYDLVLTEREDSK